MVRPSDIRKLDVVRPKLCLQRVLGANLDSMSQCGATLNPLLSCRTKLAISLKWLDEMKNVSQQTPPKITKTIWVKPLFQSFQPDSTLRN